ncbi:RNA 2',3'-cyclic phosphodiesterase [Candidatus Nanohalobium constans]|uniref:RNA 2',3'-cyclic phosphodiesterase n=1 Tax=Candidatus Nanohalobium constans TaxID=2565781 RepID=A0A5Q0UG45_9ARCH|nr:RNA 2',3'-cyclic phosphodiesterase [Candidatus Nanohalobium constans]QGA79935.1 RNA 2',3'-cyclic 3'-phosphodiesterase [Candidatus Nanohalobium constans]
MRVFTAVNIENEKVLDKLEEMQKELDYGFNKVKPGKMHLTLQFFKNVDRNELEEIKTGLNKIEMEPFKLKIKGVGVFPSKDYVRVVWAGIESEEVFELKNQVSKHSVEEDNDHKFHPHITLSRVKNIARRDKKDFRRKLEKLEDEEIAQTTVKSVKLFKSKHTGKAMVYSVLEEKEL